MRFLKPSTEGSLEIRNALSAKCAANILPRILAPEHRMLKVQSTIRLVPFHGKTNSVLKENTKRGYNNFCFSNDRW